MNTILFVPILTAASDKGPSSPGNKGFPPKFLLGHLTFLKKIFYKQVERQEVIQQTLTGKYSKQAYSRKSVKNHNRKYSDIIGSMVISQCCINFRI